MSKKRKALSLFAALLFAFQSLPCSAAEYKPAEPAGWGDEANGFKLGLSIEKTNFHVGENIVACFVLKNVSAEPHVILNNGNPSDFDIVLTDANGKIAPLTEYGRKLQLTGVTRTWLNTKSMDPRAEERREFPISKIYDLNTQGKYVVCAIRRVPDLSIKDTNQIVYSKFNGSVTSSPAIFFIAK